MPFATPPLVNARIREADVGDGRELVVVNPSGARGALIMPWEGMPDICSPSLFDRHLWESLGKADDISPIGIRRAAQRLAMQGLAGKHSAAIARDAEKRELQTQRLVRSMLLESLINTAEGSNQPLGRLAELDPEAFHKRARRAVVKSAEISGLSLQDFADDLEGLVENLGSAVPRVDGEEATLRQLLADLVSVTEDITTWLQNQLPENVQFHAARFVEQAARQTIECAEFVLAATDALIANIGLLLPNWKTDREVIFDRTLRPEWVLDGWKTPIALWLAAGPSQRGAAVIDMAMIVPILPREAKAWLGKPGEWYEAPRRVTQTAVRAKSDWRSGNSLDLVARTENLVSFSVAYENRITGIGQVETKTRLTRPLPQARNIQEDPSVAWIYQPSSTQPPEATPAPKPKQDQRPGTKAKPAIANQLEVASDEALTKIVAMVDGLGNAEMRERILGPSLHRLKRLRPPRPVSVMRLLFLPLSGALVDTAQWEGMKGFIPRSAIKPLMDTLEPALGPKAEDLARQLRGKTFDDGELIGQIGGELWRMTADAGPRLLASPFWKASALSASDVEAIVSLALGLWRHGGDIWKGMREAAGEGRTDILHAALKGPAAEDEAVFSAALQALLQRAPRPSVFAPLLKLMPAENLETFENLLVKCVGTSLNDLPEVDFATGASLAADLGGLINTLEDWHMTTRRLDAKELFAHRRGLDQYCRATYREVVSVHVAQALLKLHSGEAETLSEIEAMAQIARSLEATGKRFGAPQGYDLVQEEFLMQMEKARHDQALMAAFAGEIARIRDIMVRRDTTERFLLRVGRQGFNAN